MNKLIRSAKRFWRDDEAATAVEYGIIIALVAVSIAGVLIMLREEIRGTLNDAIGAMGSREAG